MVEPRQVRPFLPPSPRLRRTSRPCRVLPLRPIRQPLSDGPLCRSQGFSPAQASLLRRCGDRREKGASPAPPGRRPRLQLPFLQRPFSLVRVPSSFPRVPLSFSRLPPSFPRVLSLFPEASQPSLLRWPSFPPAAASNRRSSQRLHRFLPPDLRALSFRVSRLFRRR